MQEIFFILGLTIVAGFLSEYIFQRTKISEVILLMLFGFVLGPMLGIVDASAGSIVFSIMPIVATLALIILLFDAGLTLDIFSLFRSITRGTIFTFFVMILNIVLVSIFFHFILSWPLIYALMLGIVISDVSSPIILTLISRSGMSDQAKSILAIESTITDITIILMVVLTQFVSVPVELELGSLANIFLSAFTIAIAIGFVAALAWIFTLKHTAHHNYVYMVTLSIILLMYWVTEYVKASGALAVFIFGLTIGSAKIIGNYLKTDLEDPSETMIKSFQGEISFFVRTFFFVYIGLLLSPVYFSLSIILMALAVTLLIILARWIGVRVVLNKLSKMDQRLAFGLLPRGLAAAVAATVPLSKGIIVPNLQEITFIVILFTNAIATISIFIFDKPGVDENIEVEPLSA